MAIMISVPSRGTDTKKLIKEATRIAVKRYKRILVLSISLNILFITGLLIHLGKN